MKQTILSVLLMLLPMVASADAVEIDGIWYNIVAKGNVAEVTRNPSDGDKTGSYTGDIVIPEKIKTGGVEYPVTKIGDNAFNYSGKMKSVRIPNSVTSIGERAFYGCSGLKSVTIGSGLTSISMYAFYGCNGLTSITIPNGVTSIGHHAFTGCSGLTSVTIPNGVTSISASTFTSCSGLKTVSIPKSVTSIGSYAFSGCSSLESVDIPNGVTSISEHTFNGCSSLTSITIPNSVTYIGNYVFFGCSGLTSITIPNSMTYIDHEAFTNCDNLTDVYCKPEQVRKNTYYGDPGLYTDPTAFKGSYPEYITLHVPSASIEAYRAIEPWSNFKNIVALPPTCATPIIGYANDKISFSCATKGAEFISEVTVGDAKKYYDSEINLSKKYVVSVYATKTGYLNSDVATKEIEISGGSSQGDNNSGSTLKGDVNGDGKVDVADHVTLSDIIMSTGTKPDGGDDIETDKITASFLGGAYSKINGKIQSGSKLNVKFLNNSSKTVTLTKMQLNDAETGLEGNNLLTENVVVPPGQNVSYTITVGVLGITKPVIVFTYQYNNKTYQVKDEWQEIEFPSIGF